MCIRDSSQTLLPMLDEIVKMTELELESVDAIAVAAGPGSFTGLRIDVYKRQMGYNAAEELYKRVQANIAKKREEK